MKGPGIFLAQFEAAEAPFNSLKSITKWAAGHGYKGVQLSTRKSRLFDLEKAAESQDYCDEIVGICAESGLVVTELAAHGQGQLVACSPAYNEMFDGFAPQELAGNLAGKAERAADQLKKAAIASQRLGCASLATFSGAFLWQTMYPFPQRPLGLVEEGFAELARRWTPILNACDENGINACFELHPGEDLHDGATFERFLEAVGNHPRANILYDPSHFILQQLDYLAFIDLYHERIKAFHVKDAEFLPSGRVGVYGGYLGWAERAGRFRSLGDGQIDFRTIFSKLTQHGYDGWAVLEWECYLKHPEQGAAEGAPFIADHMIRRTERVFDEVARSTAPDTARNRRLLGLS